MFVIIVALCPARPSVSLGFVWVFLSSGIPTNWTLSWRGGGQSEVFCLEGCPHFRVNYACTMNVCYRVFLIYNGTPLLWTPWEPGGVSYIERCPHFRGKLYIQKKKKILHIWDTAKQRGVPLLVLVWMIIFNSSFMFSFSVSSFSSQFQSSPVCLLLSPHSSLQTQDGEQPQALAQVLLNSLAVSLTSWACHHDLVLQRP